KMPVDNEIYNRMADTWWDETGLLHILRAALNSARFGYFRDTLANSLHISPEGKRALDIGCGGGFLAEEFARIGCLVTGIDPSAPSIAAAVSHARKMGLAVDYLTGVGEDLPFENGSFDIAYCCDTLEHVNDLKKTLAETSRVLKKGGVYFYDTINRTFRSNIVAIRLLQQWRWSRIFPEDLHDWKMFIKPRELQEIMSRHGIENRELVGISPGATLLHIIRAARRHKRGEITISEM